MFVFHPNHEAKFGSGDSSFVPEFSLFRVEISAAQRRLGLTELKNTMEWKSGETIAKSNFLFLVDHEIRAQSP